MLIKLTMSKNKVEFYVDAAIIKATMRTDNLMETAVLTSFLTPKGPIQYDVLESPGEVADLVNNALAGIVKPLIQH